MFPLRHPNGQRSPVFTVCKRTLDVAVSCVVLAALSPVVLVVSVLIKAKDSGPVLYRPSRVGKDGQEFYMLKFRTMVPDAELIGGSSTASDDDRITKVGRNLRRWKIDEVPQLINVIRGEMSLVGPRPQVAWDVARYTPDERRLLSVRPGLTDWASIRFRHEGDILAKEEDPEEAYDRLIRPLKIRLGLFYVDNQSLVQDIVILVRTIDAMVRQPTAIPDNEAPNLSSVTEGWNTSANLDQWKLACQRYSLAAALCQGKRIVEVGCGTGYGLAQVSRFTEAAVGVEIDERNLRSAREQWPAGVFVRADAKRLPLADASVDCVAALEMFYYLTDQGLFLRETRRILRPGGALLITLPNRRRAAFHASPYSTTYPDSDELAQLLVAAGFHAVIYGTAPTSDSRPLFEFLRRLLVGSGLMPHSIEGRARMKSLLFRQMRSLSSILVDPSGAFVGLAELSSNQPQNEYAVLVAIGTQPKPSLA